MSTSVWLGKVASATMGTEKKVSDVVLGVGGWAYPPENLR